jgi:hypothetical protein
MKKTMLLCGLALAAETLLACGDDSKDDTVTALCRRADTCNFLNAGVSVQDCVDARRSCLSDLTTAERTDWESAVEDCLHLSSCGNFDNCYQSVPDC